MEKHFTFAIEEFNNLIGGNKKTIQDLHNYNHITPNYNNCFILFKYDFKITVNQLTKHNISKALLIYDKVIFGFDGARFVEVDFRTCCNSGYLGITDMKKRIASYNRQGVKPYILKLDEKASLIYDSYWYYNIWHRRVGYSERIKLNEIKYYYKNWQSRTAYVQAELKNGLILEGVKAYSDVLAEQLDLIVDKSGYNIQANRLRIMNKYSIKRHGMSLPKIDIPGWRY